MSKLTDSAQREVLVNRLKRAEGQLRGVQRMIDAGESCRDILSQMSAVRRALDSACVHMTVCYMGQELHSRIRLDGNEDDALGEILDDVQSMLGKLK
jgi:DNA-binding FrmR family transcriptional regulator